MSANAKFERYLVFFENIVGWWCKRLYAPSSRIRWSPK